MWTDPPYGVAYVGKNKAALTIANDDLKGDALREFLVRCFSTARRLALSDGAAVYVAHPAGALSLEFLLAFREVGWRLHQTLVWGSAPFCVCGARRGSSKLGRNVESIAMPLPERDEPVERLAP
jgi:hypothetical protein